MCVRVFVGHAASVVGAGTLGCWISSGRRHAASSGSLHVMQSWG